MARMLAAKQKVVRKAKAEVEEKPVRTRRAKVVEEVEEAPVRRTKKTKVVEEEEAPAKTARVSKKQLVTKFLLIKEQGIAAIEGVAVEVTSGFVTVAHKNRIRPGAVQTIRRIPGKSLERGVPVPGPRHFVTTVPMSKIISVHTAEENVVVTYRSEVVVERVAITGDVTYLEGNMLQVETTSGQTVIVSADNAEIVGEVSGGKVAKAAPVKQAGKAKRSKVIDEDDSESEVEEEDAEEADPEEDDAEPEDGDEDSGQEDDEAPASDDDW